MSGEGAAGGQRDSCWQLPSERLISTSAQKSTTRVLTRDIFQLRLWQPKYFLTSCRNKLQPKKKKKKTGIFDMTSWQVSDISVVSRNAPCEHLYWWFGYVKKFDWRKRRRKKNTVNGQSKKRNKKKQRPLLYIIYVQMAFSRDLAKTHYWLCGN